MSSKNRGPLDEVGLNQLFRADVRGEDDVDDLDDLDEDVLAEVQNYYDEDERLFQTSGAGRSSSSAANKPLGVADRDDGSTSADGKPEEDEQKRRDDDGLSTAALAEDGLSCENAANAVVAASSLNSTKTLEQELFDQFRSPLAGPAGGNQTAEASIELDDDEDDVADAEDNSFRSQSESPGKERDIAKTQPLLDLISMTRRSHELSVDEIADGDDHGRGKTTPSVAEQQQAHKEDEQRAAIVHEALQNLRNVLNMSSDTNLRMSAPGSLAGGTRTRSSAASVEEAGAAAGAAGASEEESGAAAGAAASEDEEEEDSHDSEGEDSDSDEEDSDEDDEDNDQHNVTAPGGSSSSGSAAGASKGRAGTAAALLSDRLAAVAGSAAAAAGGASPPKAKGKFAQNFRSTSLQINASYVEQRIKEAERTGYDPRYSTSGQDFFLGSDPDKSLRKEQDGVENKSGKASLHDIAKGIQIAMSKAAASPAASRPGTGFGLESPTGTAPRTGVGRMIFSATPSPEKSASPLKKEELEAHLRYRTPTPKPEASPKMDGTTPKMLLSMAESNSKAGSAEDGTPTAAAGKTAGNGEDACASFLTADGGQAITDVLASCKTAVDKIVSEAMKRPHLLEQGSARQQAVEKLANQIRDMQIEHQTVSEKEATAARRAEVDRLVAEMLAKNKAAEKADANEDRFAVKIITAEDREAEERERKAKEKEGSAKKLKPKKKKNKDHDKVLAYFETKYPVMTEVVQAMGPMWKQCQNDALAELIWSDQSIPAERFTKLKTYQKINHFVGMCAITRKNNLGRNLLRMKKYYPKEYRFFPDTWILPTDMSDFKAQFQQGSKYIAKPFLLDGHKFDLRLYVLVTGCDPLRIYLHEKGLVRLASERYIAPKSKNLEKQMVHLTNYSINAKIKGRARKLVFSPTFKTNPRFEENNDVEDGASGHKRGLTPVVKYLKEHYGVDTDKLFREIEDLIVKSDSLPFSK
eukprot:g12265.t1